MQDHEYSRFGGRDILKADVRILAATNQDLEKAVKEKRFREDLYFRLKVIPIYLPPLRERRGDIPLLIGYFIDKINREMGIQISGVSPEAQRLLEDHSWPGNVREIGKYADPRRGSLVRPDSRFLKISRCKTKPAAPTLEVDQLSLEEIIRHKLEDYFRRTEGVDVDNLYSLVIERVERPLIELTLKKTKGNQIRAAQILGINRNTLRKKITDLRIELKKEASLSHGLCELPPLYAILDPEQTQRPPRRDGFRGLLEAGVSILQLRVKSLPPVDFLDSPSDARTATRTHDCKLIVNDRIDIALACDADGVHLGQDDLPLSAGRKLMGTKNRWHLDS